MQNKRMEYVSGNRSSFRIKVNFSSGSMWPKTTKRVFFLITRKWSGHLFFIHRVPLRDANTMAGL